jgi:hypothetical protein
MSSTFSAKLRTGMEDCSAFACVRLFLEFDTLVDHAGRRFIGDPNPTMKRVRISAYQSIFYGQE